MVFELKNKVAIVTGGASGIGIFCVKELLRNGAKGVTLADVNETFGYKALKEIEEEFGVNRAIFVKTDVSNAKQFEEAFQKTIIEFKNVDILVNNAGILNDSIWEKEIAINLQGTINGILLGMEKYLPKYKQGDEALIVNVASTAGVDSYPPMPVYCATKHAILGLTKCWGTEDHYAATKVRIVAACPGVTSTPLFLDMAGRNFGKRYDGILEKCVGSWLKQEPQFLAGEMMKIMKLAPNGTMWIVEGGEPVYQYIFPDRTTMKKNTIL